MENNHLNKIDPLLEPPIVEETIEEKVQNVTVTHSAWDYFKYWIYSETMVLYFNIKYYFR